LQEANKSSKILLRSSLRRLLSALTLIVMDALALLVGLVLASYLVGDEDRVEEIVYFAPVLLVVWLSIFAAHDLYNRGPSRRNPGRVLAAILWGMGLLTMGSSLYSQSGFSLKEVLLGVFFVASLSIGLRFLYEQVIDFIYRGKLGLIPTIIIGADEERARVCQLMEKASSAYICAGELNVEDGVVNLPLLRQLLERTGVRTIILTGAERLSEPQFLELLRSMSLRRVKVELAPGASTLVSTNATISHDMGIPLLEVGYPELDTTQWAMKRVLDIVTSLVGLIVLSPLLVVVALLIKLTSPGPVFFKQKRVGADGKVFICYKFRSMYNDAEQHQAELEELNESGGATFKIKNDPRITPIGRFIRRWSIDELPQLINVHKGEMSLVGPRPLPLRDYEQMGELHKKRLATIPGITGYWQISGRSSVSFEDMIRLDHYYIEHWSLSLDIKIILKTLGAVLKRKGAY
jgi:exopolysaccharide biosynthesis polyprenyl glycosylphosphotransferase